MIYLTILALLMFLSFRYDICGKTNDKEFWYFVVLCIFILFAGLRWRVGADTIHYLYDFYHEYPTLANFSFKEYYIGKDPFYVLLNSVVKSAGGRFYMVQLIQAAFVNILILNYFKKHSQYVFTCCMFYFLVSYVSFTMGTMRASFSLAISLYAFDYFIERKWLKGYGLLLVALMFHAQTLLVFLFPVFFFLRLNKKGILILLMGAYILGIFLQNLLADYIFLFEGNESLEDKLSGYTEEGAVFGENTRNINYFIVKMFPNIFYPLFALWYINKYCENERKTILKRFEPLVMFGVVFVFIQIHFLIAYRYVEYFFVYFFIYYAELYINLTRNNRLKIGISYFRTMAFFFPVMISLVYFISYKDPTCNYSSVIRKAISKKKEEKLMEMWPYSYNSPNYNEY